MKPILYAIVFAALVFGAVFSFFVVTPPVIDQQTVTKTLDPNQAFARSTP